MNYQDLYNYLDEHGIDSTLAEISNWLHMLSQSWTDKDMLQEVAREKAALDRAREIIATPLRKRVAIRPL